MICALKECFVIVKYIDVFEQFRKMCLEQPLIKLGVMLKMIDVELDLVSDIDMYWYVLIYIEMRGRANYIA